MAEETGWSEKGKRSGKGSRPPKDAGIASAADEGAAATSGEGTTTPSRPSTRGAAGDAGQAPAVARVPAGSGARKVQRAAATAGQRDVSFASRLGFPALVALVCLLGLGAVFYAWTTRDALATPRQNVDHWHSVYGVYDCTQPGESKYLPPFLSADDATGIHSHGDGIMHIHPFFELSSGENALMHHWFTEMRIDVTPEKIVLDTGAELVAGTECADGGGAAEISILHWEFDFQATDGQDPANVYTEDFGSIKFNHDREVYVIAFAGPDSEIGIPPAERFETLKTVSNEITYNPTELVPQDSGVDEGDG